jgi:hypothetical protein
MAIDGSVSARSQASGVVESGAGSARGVRPVCDPQVPSSFRRWALGQRPAYSPRGDLAVLVPGGSSAGVRPTACFWLLAAASMIVLIADPIAIGRIGWLAAAAAAAMAAIAIRHRASRRDLRLCRSKVIFPENLDETCRALLERVQSAISIILGSDVRAAGLLGNPIDDETLRQHEWEIAGKLREITSLRALLAENIAKNPAGPMTVDILSAHQRAIELAQDATTARILAIEGYATQVTAADEADRDWQQAVKLSTLNDKYLDLVARTATDEYATGEITGLTEQLAATALARYDRLREADLAASTLALLAKPVLPGQVR